MNRMTVILAATLLFLFGCASQEYYHQILQTWEGGDANQLVKVWGYPDKQITAPNGNRVYVYEAESSYTSPVTHEVIQDDDDDPYVYTTGGDTYHYRCATYFEVDNKQQIVNWQTKGNNCLASEGGDKERLRSSG